MKKLLLAVALVALMGGMAQAETVRWDRNNDAITDSYDVWACFTLNCVVLKTASTLQAPSVPQTALGVKPTYGIDLTGLSGSVAVSAKRSSGEESPLSSAVNFTATPVVNPAPGTPVGTEILP